MGIKLIDSVVEEHRSNHPDDQEDRYWGDSWQEPAVGGEYRAWRLAAQRSDGPGKFTRKSGAHGSRQADTLTYDFVKFRITWMKTEQSFIPATPRGEELARRTKILASPASCS